MADQKSRGGKKEAAGRQQQGKKHQPSHLSEKPGRAPGAEQEIRERRHAEHERGEDEKH